MRPRAVRVIAEAGVNHNGSPELALQLVWAAAESGADMVKFQTFRAAALVAADTPRAPYQERTTDASTQQLAMLAELELDAETHRDLIDCCRESGIEFLSTPFDIASADLLRDLGIQTWKIPSGAITDLPYLRHIGRFNQETIVSTGMATLEEVRACVDALTTAGTERGRITLLQCNTAYPTPYVDANLNAMHTLRNSFPGIAGVGYSDHTQGTEVAMAAAAMGATTIEKHFTMDRYLPGPDHAASLEPHELRHMIEAIRHVEQAMGDGVKQPSPSESENVAAARKSLVAVRAIAVGETFSAENVTTKRPGTGISPMLWDSLLGRKAERAYAPDERIEW